MINEQFQEKLDELLANPKTKNFINHLVKNYIPINKIYKVEETPNKKDFKCVITKKDVISYEHFLKTNESLTSDSTIKYPIMELPDSDLALQGQNTDTYMSYTSYKQFYNWVVNCVINHNKHILWLLGDINRKEFINQFKGVDNKTQINNNKSYKKEVNERSMFVLGDLSVLQELKNKMK